jgi:AcrR family transcriptional regulator
MKAKRAYSMTARSASAAHTQQRILAAARGRFLVCPYEEVTLAGVAEDAGVSTQTVLNRFGTKECLFLAFAAEFFSEMDALRSSVRRGDPRSAVRVVLQQYELMGDLNVRVLALEARLPALAEVSQLGRERHRGWLADTFGELLPAESRARRETVTALYAATDVYVWKLLRRDLGVSLAEATRIMDRLVRGALTRTPEENQK